VTAIANEVASIKSSRLKEIFLTLIYPLLIAAIFAVLNPIADYYVKNYLENRSNSISPREVKKNVRKSVPSYVDNRSDLKPYRFVSRQELEVHTHPSSGSPTLGNLDLGQIVVLLEKRKAWSLVAWSSDAEYSNLQGWVFTRYVSKIC